MSIDSNPAAVLTEHISEALRRAGQLPADALITNAVVCVQTVRDGERGPKYELHRVYPFGPMDPSTERGVLRDALHDSDAERHAS
jgi:hypothetical protein